MEVASILLRVIAALVAFALIGGAGGAARGCGYTVDAACFMQVSTEPSRDGCGRPRIGDACRVIHGRDLPVGARLRITGTDGTDLSVEDASAIS